MLLYEKSQQMQQGQGAMNELVSQASLCSPASPPSFFSAAAGHHSVLEFVSCGVPEQWLLGEEALDKPMHDGSEWVAGGSHDSACSDLSSNPPAAAVGLSDRTARRRGTKPGPRSDNPGISHIEAERQRREKLNRRFCDLRAAVPTVSRMDKASLLADAAAYIAELRGRVEQLEAEAKQQVAARKLGGSKPAMCPASGGLEEKLEVRMVGSHGAAVRLTTASTRHAPALLMGALRLLDLPVQNACVSRVGGSATVQDAVVDVPAALQEEGCLRAALLHVLQQDESA
ncbi:transcription factor bHLH14-like [Miscanthus floridulus]|uniref:transcription factor bHLH14-like n=1 Tax=Miscanthus floridulus TaxID=154761 RepID=UPI0034598739